MARESVASSCQPRQIMAEEGRRVEMLLSSWTGVKNAKLWRKVYGERKYVLSSVMKRVQGSGEKTIPRLRDPTFCPPWAARASSHNHGFKLLLNLVLASKPRAVQISDL